MAIVSAEAKEIEKQYNKVCQEFIGERALIAKEMIDLKERIEKIKLIDPTLINFDYGDLNPEVALSAMYEEPYVEEKYLEQRDKVMDILNKLKVIQLDLIKEAQRIMKGAE